MRLNDYQWKLLAAAAVGTPYGDPHALDYLRRSGLVDIKDMTISLTDAGRKVLKTKSEK